MKKKKKAFTLVELLGVLVVLSIITLVLFPLISTYVENTRKKTYDSEMDIIIVGLKNYSTEHEEILPLNEGEYVILTLETDEDVIITNWIILSYNFIFFSIFNSMYV